MFHSSALCHALLAVLLATSSLCITEVHAAPTTELCQQMSSNFSSIQLRYGREIVSSTRNENGLVLLSDLAWGVVQYLQACESDSTIPAGNSTSEEEIANYSRYLHLSRQEPKYTDVSWPQKDSSYSSVQLLTDFMAANTPESTGEDEDDDDDVEYVDDGEEDEIFPNIFVEMSLIETKELHEDGTWRGIYSYLPWGFLLKLSEKKGQWKNSYQHHYRSMQHFHSLRAAFPFFQAVNINNRADIADKKLQKYKKMSKRRQKKETPHYARRLISSIFQMNDNSTIAELIPHSDSNSEHFLKAYSVDSVEFAVARQYVDAHSELAMHMMTSSLSVSKQVAKKNGNFDYYQCARTLDRLMIASDIFTSAIESLYRFSQDAHGVGTYKSMEVLFSRGFLPTSTHIFGLMKNLVFTVEHVVSRIGFFLRSPDNYTPDLVYELFSPEVSDENRLILHPDFLSGSIVNMPSLNMTGTLLINSIQELQRLVKGLSEDDTGRYEYFVNFTERDYGDLEVQRFNAAEKKLKEERERKNETEVMTIADADHVEL